MWCLCSYTYGNKYHKYSICMSASHSKETTRTDVPLQMRCTDGCVSAAQLLVAGVTLAECVPCAFLLGDPWVLVCTSTHS